MNISFHIKWCRINLRMFRKHLLFFSFIQICFLIWHNIINIFRFIDSIIFPNVKNIEVKSPIFIMGHPRSGTTYIHKEFSKRGQLATFKTWHILVPSLSLRWLLKPIIHRVVKNNKSVILPEYTGHKIDLNEIEEEEMLFLHSGDTQFAIIGTSVGFSDELFLKQRMHDEQSYKKRIKSGLFLKRCFQQQIKYTGKTQIFAQMNFSIHRVKTIIEIFPDAKFIFINRPIEETIPSYFSLLRKTLRRFWGKVFTEEQFEVYFKNRYQASIDLYNQLNSIISEIDKEKVLCLHYSQLVNNHNEFNNQISKFTGIEISSNNYKYERKHTNMEFKYDFMCKK